ncbi:hypothetical protein SEA_DUMPTRUCK_75 [Gordonia phage DumpTruck]|nr:hypothetical protein SEA_DUMPTRUCK_75 [Gordonia phage DumpTruck]
MAGKNVARFLKHARNQIWAFVHFEESYDRSHDRTTEVVDLGTQSPRTSNCVSSQIHPDSFNDWRRGSPRQYHKPILDIDFEAALVPSTTEGHYHLFLDKEMEWRDYEKLLRVLAEVGILEPGYVKAAQRRKATWVRAPWTKKPQATSEAEDFFMMDGAEFGRGDLVTDSPTRPIAEVLRDQKALEDKGLNF